MVYFKLGEILLQQGLITEDQLKKAIAAQNQEQGRIGEIFVKLGIIKEEDMIAALGELQARHPFRLQKEQLRVAVNTEFCDWQAPLNSGDTVVFIPPVAGG